MDAYEKGEKIGMGTYGIVYRGLKKDTTDVVALKKILMGKKSDGVNFTVYRELKVLQEARHENIIPLLDTFVHKSNVWLVYPLMDSDLETGVIKNTQIVLSAADIKSYMQMILRGVDYLHRHWILHRDLKPNNLLIGVDGVVRIADFGFARYYGSPNPRYTDQVVTRWYRPPELLFGAKAYGPAVDMWSVGCVFAELMLRIPYFAGDNDLEQLSKIFAALGTPTEDTWPGVESLPTYVRFEYSPGTPMKQIFTAAGDDALDLLSQVLKFDPNKRLEASQALKHRYFTNEPAPTPPNELQWAPFPQAAKAASAAAASASSLQTPADRLLLGAADLPDSSDGVLGKRKGLLGRDSGEFLNFKSPFKRTLEFSPDEAGLNKRRAVKLSSAGSDLSPV